jgi:hypothetical protein
VRLLLGLMAPVHERGAAGGGALAHGGAAVAEAALLLSSFSPCLSVGEVAESLVLR